MFADISFLILTLQLLLPLTEAVGFAEELYCGLENCYDGKSFISK